MLMAVRLRYVCAVDWGGPRRGRLELGSLDIYGRGGFLLEDVRARLGLLVIRASSFGM